MTIKPLPKTRIADVVETIGGITVHDFYRWLEGNTTPEVRTWVDEQNTYSRSFLDQISSRDTINARLHEVFNIDTVEYRLGGKNECPLPEDYSASAEQKIDFEVYYDDKSKEYKLNEGKKVDGKWEYVPLDLTPQQLAPM